MRKNRNREALAMGRLPTSAYRQAVGFLEQTVTRHRRMGRARLPTVRALAGQSGVAVVTMWKAVRELCSRGELAARRGRGLTLPGSASGERQGAAASDRAERRWETVKARLASDVLEGAFRSSPALPSPKELCRLYGACYRTVRRAVRALVSEGVLEAHKRTYVLRRYAGRASRDTLVLIAGGFARGELRLFSHRTHELLREAEAQCSKAGLRLEVVPFDLDSRTLPSRALGSRGTRDAPAGPQHVLGCMVLLNGIPDSSRSEIVSRATRGGMRVSLLDEGTVLGRSPVFPSPLARTFSVASNRTACRQVALHLLALGHRRVAFVSPITDGDWAQDRCEALAQAFADAGVPDAVFACVAPQAPAGSPPAFVPPARPSYGPELDQLMARSRSVKSLRYQLELVMQRETVRGVLTPLMEQALAAPGVSAWVAANDDMALECMDFLDSRGRRVPEDISVVGFDDNLEAFFRKLTSFDYNAPGAIHAMLAHVLEPRPGRPRRAPEPVTEISGFVNVRGSTGRAQRL